MYRLASFDFDGTLADSGDWFFTTLNTLAAEFGFRPLAVEDRERVRGMQTREVVEHLQVPLWKLPRLMARMRALGARERHRIALFRGVKELFTALETAGVQIGIVSSNTEETIRHTLGGLADRVAFYECGSSLFGKAAKLKKLVRKAQITAAEAIYIGDETRDGLAAREARMDFAAVAWGYASVEALQTHSPRFVFQTIEDAIRELTLSIPNNLRAGLAPPPVPFECPRPNE